MLLESAWLQPELTAVNRLPMHSVPHQRRLVLDGTWRFQLLNRPDAEPGANWRQIEVPGCWTMQDVGDSPQYTNVVMPFDGRPPEVPPRTAHGRPHVAFVPGPSRVLTAY